MALHEVMVLGGVMALCGVMVLRGVMVLHGVMALCGAMVLHGVMAGICGACMGLNVVFMCGVWYCMELDGAWD